MDSRRGALLIAVDVTEIHRHSDYRSYLRELLESRCRANPRYSLRALARDLDLAPSRVSEVLSGKRGLTANLAARVSQKLDHSSSDARLFLDLVLKSDARSPLVRSQAAQRVDSVGSGYNTLTLDSFRVISDWYHYAILELSYVEKLPDEPRYVARRLGLSAAEASGAIERLKRLGLIVVKRGQLKKTDALLTTTADLPSEAIRGFHRQVLEKALGALEVQGVEARDYSSVTMAIDPERIPAAKERIRRFRRELCEFLEGGPRSQVYVLACQLFRLDQRSPT